jgi:glycosyltransferase involved in cell wall biosynthesis
MPAQETANFAVVIPAYRPSATLIGLLEALAAKAFPAVVVVDDGSGPEFRELFARAAAFPNVRLTRHAVNLGKGAALRTGIHLALSEFPDVAGVVTADADGQHHPDDIERIGRRLIERPDALVLGCRTFGEDVPLRSRFGNVATRTVMHAILGQRLSDTQTGLRGIPHRLIPHILRLESRGYEFELEMLIAAHQLSIPTVEEPIRTIYEPGNKSSHFNPVIDSMKIYFVLLRFASISALTAALDNLIFILMYRRTGHILLSQVVGRGFAVAFNYWMVRSSVFYSKQRHRAILPKYLTLVAVSGTASYWGIRALSGGWGVNPVVAKPLVETLLFFVNFAVQRLFIFQPQEGLAIPRRAQDLTFALLAMGAVIAVTAAEIHGFRMERLFQQFIWLPWGLHRFWHFTGLFTAWSLPLLLMFSWAYTSIAAALLTFGTLLATGSQAIGAVVLLLVSSCALGSLLLGNSKERLAEHHICATLFGLALYAFLMTCAARCPVNYPTAWAAVLATPIFFDLRGVLRRFSQWETTIRSAELADWRVRGAFAVLLFVLAIQWFAVIEPETGADALAMHLAVPANIAAHHAFTFRPDRYIWSVMPMAADFGYSIVYLLGGEPATSLLNFALLLAITALLYSALRRFVEPAPSYLLAALFVSTPLVQLVTGSLFVENFTAAMILGMMISIWRFGESRHRRYLMLAATLGGTAVAAKFAGWSFALAAIPFAVVEIRRNRKFLAPRRSLFCTLCVVLLLATAVPPYLIAWRTTGNPFFPFLNHRFPSAMLDPAAEIGDSRFSQSIGWSLPYDLTIHTHRFFEGLNGSFGFQYLLFIPLAAISLLVLRRRTAASAAVVALAAGAAILASQPNARYVYAALPLLTVAFGALVAWSQENQAWLARVLLIFATACTGLNAWFAPSSGWSHKDFYSPTVFLRNGRSRYIRESSPVRDVVQHFRGAHPHAPVLLVEENDLTDAGDHTHLDQWHEYRLWRRVAAAEHAADLRRIFQSLGVRYFIARHPGPEEYPLKPESLRRFLADCVTAEYENGRYYEARTDPGCETLSDAALEKKLEADSPDVSAAGAYDDSDLAVRFRGHWTRDDSFGRASHGTITYSNSPGAEAAFAFDGRSLTYVYTKAFNRGVAELTLDGETHRIDLYSPSIEWQSRSEFCCLGAGKHLVTLRVTGESRAESQGKYVDLDSFIAR